MARQKAATPSKVLCARAPAELWQPVYSLRDESGKRVSELIRDGLRAQLKPKGDFQEFVVKELLQAAEKKQDVAEVAGLLLDGAQTKKEEKFVEATALKIAELSEAPKATKAKPKNTAEQVQQAFLNASSAAQVRDIEKRLLANSYGKQEDKVIKAGARAAIRQAKAALAAQKKALKPKKPKAPKTAPAQTRAQLRAAWTTEAKNHPEPFLDSEIKRIKALPVPQRKASATYFAVITAEKKARKKQDKEEKEYTKDREQRIKNFEADLKTSTLNELAFERDRNEALERRYTGEQNERGATLARQYIRLIDEEQRRRSKNLPTALELSESPPAVIDRLFSLTNTRAAVASAKKELLQTYPRESQYIRRVAAAQLQHVSKLEDEKKNSDLPSVWEEQKDLWDNKIYSQPTIEDLDILQGAIERAKPPQKDLERMLNRIKERAEMVAQEKKLDQIRAEAKDRKTAGQRYEEQRRAKEAQTKADKERRARESADKKAREEGDRERRALEERRAEQRRRSEENEARRSQEEPREACEGEGCEYSITGAKCSIKAPLIVGAKEGGVFSAPARYCLIELGKLKPSHQPLRNYSPTPGYPPDAQERDYQSEKGEQIKVQQIADKYEPSLVFNTSPGAIDGVPVANEEGIILGGNGRTMATALVYAGEAKNATPDTIKNYLRAHAAQFGFTPAQVDQYAQPMIVRTVRTKESGPAELAQWSRRLNQSMSQALSPTLIAVSRAKFLDPRALQELAQLPDNETIAAWLSTQSSRGFVRSLSESGIIDPRNSATFLLPSGLLSPDGRDLVNDLLVAVLIPNAQLIKALGPGITATIGRAAPYLAQLQALGPYDVRPQFTLAVRDFVSLSAQGFTDVGRYLAQGGLFGVSPQVQKNRTAETWLEILFQLQGSPAKLSKLARHYLQLAKAPGTGQMGLLSSENFTPLQALQHAARAQGVQL